MSRAARSARPERQDRANRGQHRAARPGQCNDRGAGRPAVPRSASRQKRDGGARISSSLRPRTDTCRMPAGPSMEPGLGMAQNAESRAENSRRRHTRCHPATARCQWPAPRFCRSKTATYLWSSGRASRTRRRKRVKSAWHWRASVPFSRYVKVSMRSNTPAWIERRMIFRDDECRPQTDHAPASFCTIRHMAQNLIRRAPGKASFRRRRKAPG